MILPIEKQVTSLELSKRIGELGFEQESLWYWYCQFPFSSTRWELIKKYPNDYVGDETMLSAYTVAELLKIIYDMTGMFPVIHDRDLKPEELLDYLAGVACDLKADDD